MIGITCNSKFNSLSGYARKLLRLFRSVLHLSYAASNEFLLLSANIRIMYRCPRRLMFQNLSFMYHRQVHHKSSTKFHPLQVSLQPRNDTTSLFLLLFYIRVHCTSHSPC